MLTIHQARLSHHTGTGPMTGLAIAGGGPLGAIYELGALRALDESLEGIDLHELDVYVGVSAGAFIAASLANRISTAELCRIFMGDKHAGVRWAPERFLRPAYGEYMNRATRVPTILRNTLMKLIRNPGRFSVSELIGELGQVVPSGIFDNETIHDFLEESFVATGHGNRFSDLEARLYIVAVDLDTGAAVRFGSEENDQVPISLAVQASGALPGLYPPVEIEGRYFVDGALRRTLHASAALDEGVDLLFGINPLVPFDASERPPGTLLPARKLIRGGLPVILSQTFRALIQSRMKIGFQKYRSTHPATDLILLEPDRGDEQIFFTNIFSYSSRNALCEHAYQTTRIDLLSRAAELTPQLAKHGIRLRTGRLKETDRTLTDSLRSPGAGYSRVSQKLARALDDLEVMLEHHKAV